MFSTSLQDEMEQRTSNAKTWEIRGKYWNLCYFVSSVLLLMQDDSM
ncbi:hypothetical protein PVAP13_9NG495128 [Panicum virgatum]|uniref:Uncharacterized protein n=1 Tax=Panicum virgatum TaxID=38727 RepID=A0A8T0MTD5_PANVG|nr:hypothetical protein PVAP13_9NG495128 [Panicum virgatum]